MRPEDRERKLAVLTVIGLILLLLVAGRLLDLSLVQGPTLAQMGDSYRLRVMPIPAARGKIYDRSGHLLVTNRPAFAAYYFSLGGPPKTLEASILAKDLDMTPAELQRAIRSFTGAPYIPVLLKSGLTAVELTRVKQDQGRLPGVFVNAIPLREDLLGSIGGQVIGYVSRISKVELQSWKDPRLTGNTIVGQAGLELQYQKELQGTDGGQEVEVDALNRPVKVLGEMAPVPGDNLVLTLDESLEKTSVTALQQDMTLLQQTYGAKAPSRAGAVVVMDVHTGQILAMASLPSYDPNAFAGGISATDYQALATNPALPFLNRVIQVSYPPGSSYKMTVALAGLLSNSIPLNFTVQGQPRYWYPPFPKNWINAYTGINNIVKALAQSNDIFFYEVGRLTGIDNIAKYAHMLGFGQLTGIDLPGEVPGLIPTEAYYIKKDGAFYPGLRYSVAIGQGADQVTIIQMVRYVAAVATDGLVYRPYLVDKVLSPTGKVISVTKPDLLGKVSAPQSYWDAIHQGMQDVTHPGTIPGNGGTAGAAWVNFPMEVAGKTGTAQVPGAGAMTFFVSYAPYNDPQIAVVVAVEGGAEGAMDAPVVRAIYDAYFHLNDPNPPFANLATTPTGTGVTVTPGTHGP